MVRSSVNRAPADIKVIIFRPFFTLSFSFEDFTSSRDTALYITIDTIATMEIISVDIFNASLIYDLIFSKFNIYHSVK